MSSDPTYSLQPTAYSPSSAAPPPWPSPRHAWYVIFVLMVAYTLSYIDRTIVDLLVEPIKADLGLSDTQFSLLRGLAFAIFYTVLGIPFGIWADHSNRRNIIAIGIAFWSLMTALCGFARTFGQLFLARVGVGIGEAALTPAAYSMIADYFPPEKRGRALGVYAMGVFIGIGLAIMIGGFVVAAVARVPVVTLPIVGEIRSWQVAFMAVGLPGLLVALWVMTIAEPLRRGAGAPEHPWSMFRQALVFIRSQWRFFALHFGGYALLTMLFNALTAWIPAYLIRTHGYTAGDIAITYGPLLLVFGSAGIYCGGWLADTLRKRGHRDAEMRAGLYSALLLWPFAALTTLMPTDTLALAMLAPLLFFASFPFAAAASALQLVTPNRLRAQVSAFYLLIVNLTGIGFGGTLTALVTDYVFADELAVGRAMALVGLILAPLAAILLWRGMYHLRLSAAASD
ncbi:MAG TPA: MFS transporter [Steroidobacteraceae bacterium]|nr:MFS transporter [Steroidobacteraceae bacterium]